MIVDDRRVYLSPSAGPWYSSNPGSFHTSRSCAGRGIWERHQDRERWRPKDLSTVREEFLEKAVKEGYTACGICAADIDHDFEPADYPPDPRISTDGGAEEPSLEHPDLDILEIGDTIRVTVGDDVVIGTVDGLRHSEDGQVAGHSLSVIEGGHGGRMRRVLDVETQHDPRTGWDDLVAIERIYTGEPPTEFVELGPAGVEIVDPGVDPDLLEPGRVVELLDGDEYRVVIPPWEREYDSKALVFNLEASGNFVERADPAEVIRLVR